MPSWDRRIDLSSQEKEAIRVYIEAGDYINSCLRGRTQIPKAFTPLFDRLIQRLDSAITKSKIYRNCIIYRGISCEYVDELLEDIAQGRRELNDKAYLSFSEDPEIAKEFSSICKDRGVIFVVECQSGECALVIGGEESEIVFPRNMRWNIITTERKRCEDRSITFIYLEKI
jgi:hypothetical protein